MKLKKFKNTNKKGIGVLLFTILCIVLVSGVILYRTFAIFEVKTNQNVIKGTVQDPGNLYFAFYVDDKIQKDMPNKDKDYVFNSQKSYCGVLGEKDDSIKLWWNRNDWAVVVSGMTQSRTKCNLYFEKGENLIDKIKISTTAESGDGLYVVSHDGLTGTANDDGFRETEYRYAGKNPYNYITFNGETWRIIGLVNVLVSQSDGNQKIEQRVKIIRNESIGNLSWDTSKSGVNSGYGVNEWGQADLMKLLNPGYEIDLGGSLYWNSSSGSCYIGVNNASSSCDFTTNGFKDKYSDLIEEVVWNTGSNGTHYTFNNINVNKFYEIERSDHIANESCINSSYCNDSVERQTTWKGKVGLMYPSDYGFASSNVAENDVCKTINMYNWNEHSECTDTNWLSTSNAQWTITPCNAIISGGSNFSAVDAFSIRDKRVKDEWIVGSTNLMVRPAVYLKQDVLVSSLTNGSIDSPYIIG